MMVLASLLFATMGVCVKLASAHYATGEIVFYRGLTGVLLMWGFARWQGGTLRTSLASMHFWRSLSGVTALCLWFYAIGNLPLATAMTLNYMSSVWMALFLVGGAIMLGSQRVDGRLIATILFGFAGVGLILLATIDQVNGGRTTLGMGGGWSQVEYDAYGIPFGTAGSRLRLLEESIQCVRGLLTQDRTNFAGQHFTLTDAACEPKPVQERLPIWVGGGGEKITLRIAAQHADGWNIPFVAPEEWGRKSGILTDHCHALGRDPGEITRSVNVGMALDDDDLRGQFASMAEFVRPGVLIGAGNELVDRVGAYVDQGAQWVILALRAPFDRAGLERFAAEVLPAFATRA